MKTFLKAAAFSMIAVFFVACSGSEGPEGNAKAYLDAVTANDFDKAKEFATEDTKGMLDFMKQISAMGGEKAAEEAKTYSDLKCTVNADTAAVCTYKAGDKDETINMKKTGEKWLVHQPKENPMGGAEGGEMMEAGDEMMDAGAELIQDGAEAVKDGAAEVEKAAADHK